MDIFRPAAKTIGISVLLTSCVLGRNEIFTPTQVQHRIDSLDGHAVTVEGYLIFEHHNYTIWDSETAAETYLDRLDEFENDPCLNIDVPREGYDVLKGASHQQVMISGVVDRDIFSGRVAFGSCTVSGILVDVSSLKVIGEGEE